MFLKSAFTQKRPWIIKTNKANSKGIKVVEEGIQEVEIKLMKET